MQALEWRADSIKLSTLATTSCAMLASPLAASAHVTLIVQPLSSVLTLGTRLIAVPGYMDTVLSLIALDLDCHVHPSRHCR